MSEEMAIGLVGVMALRRAYCRAAPFFALHKLYFGFFLSEIIKKCSSGAGAMACG